MLQTTHQSRTGEWVSFVYQEITRKNIKPTCVHVTKTFNGSNMGGWIEGFSTEALNELLLTLSGADFDADSTVEIFIGYDDRSILYDGKVKLPKQIERGLTGLAINDGKKMHRVCPSVMLRKNKNFLETFEAILHQVSSKKKKPLSVRTCKENTDVIAFSTCQFIIHGIGQSSTPIPVYRGKQIIALEEVTFERVKILARSLSDWMLRHVAANGRLTYCYHPDDDKYLPNTNRIREFMGTTALFKIAQFYDDKRILEIAERNLKYNLKEYCHEEDSYAVIIEGAKIKLGAVSLAALAIRQSPKRKEYAEQMTRLQRFTEMMWQESGMFRTFLRPIGRDKDCQNFYPGETLLFWVENWIESRDQALLDKIEASFNYYKDWHRNNKNPAFIPWHTQAYYLLWQETGDERLKDFIFEMNDWLVHFQQWDQIANYPDAQGRFYDPDKPYGPPHASSTGVYIEGLIDAFKLARQISDMDRAERYALTIRRALRNILQLQFSERYELASLPNGEMAFGGIRTTEYNNIIRVDNVQHNLMGVIKILKEPEFLWD